MHRDNYSSFRIIYQDNMWTFLTDNIKTLMPRILINWLESTGEILGKNFHFLYTHNFSFHQINDIFME